MRTSARAGATARLLTAVFCAACAACAAAADATSSSNALAREMLAQLIAINTTDSVRGNVTTAAEAMAQRLRSAGFPAEDIRVLGPSERK
ncbi:MAG TPA: hypothetical protein VKB20_00950, partial [Steroidobacteraceae bacterium]|nr:hypothetical protein [Steroidobacteraceae bacterium]